MQFFERKWPAILLWPVSLFYGVILSLRNFFYDVGLLKSHTINCYVVSVGNISVGGTGKTPTVMYLANAFLARQKRVVIISRGYGRKSRGTVIVSEGNETLVAVQESGDEPLLLALSCPGAIVIVDADRVRAAKLAVQKYNPEVIILDDAFQHRRIRRNFDLVTMRAASPFGNGFCFPAGPLREPKRFIRRADALLLNGEGAAGLGLPARAIFSAGYEPVALVDKNGAHIDANLGGKKILAFCGLANPHSFRLTLIKLNANLAELLTFPDHHYFSPTDISNIVQAARKAQVELIITTEKDWMKLPPAAIGDNWVRLQVRLKPSEEEKLLSLFEILN